jgi:hypothetical protein
MPLDEPPMPARVDPMPSPGVTVAERPDSEEWPPAAGMTQMASGTMDPTPVVAGNDALTELRRRLIERPLRVPELGELKPTGGDRAGKDGWIRF